MILSAQDLKTFYEVALSKNMSRAAEKLGLTQPALSHTVKKIENEVGTPLFERLKTGLKLTRAGERLLEKSRHLLEEWESVYQYVKEEENKVSGLYKIGCHPSVAIYSLPLFLPKVLSDYPELEIDLFHGLSRLISENVISHKIDIGLVVNPPRHPDLVIKELVSDVVTLWVAKGKKVPSTLLCDPELLQSQWILTQLEKSKLRFQHRLYSSNLEVIAKLTEAGCGIGLLPSRVALAMVPGKLTLYSKDAPRYPDKLCLIYRSGFQKSLGARVLIDAILNIKIQKSFA
jgi:DNA-binding transcriptional LysR family regulator